MVFARFAVDFQCRGTPAARLLRSISFRKTMETVVQVRSRIDTSNEAAGDPSVDIIIICATVPTLLK